MDRCIGLLRWLSAGFTCGRSGLVWLTHNRTAWNVDQSVHEQRVKHAKCPSAYRGKLTVASRNVILFWSGFFPSWNRRCPIVKHFSPTATWELFGRVDASTDWGCGGFCFVPGAPMLYYLTHKWSEPERDQAMVDVRESTTYFELLACQLWMELFSSRCTGKRVMLENDNVACVLGLNRSFSVIPALIPMISRVRSICAIDHIQLYVGHVIGILFNKIADSLSHNDFHQAQCAAQQEFGLQLQLVQ